MPPLLHPLFCSFIHLTFVENCLCARHSSGFGTRKKTRHLSSKSAVQEGKETTYRSSNKKARTFQIVVK